MRFREIFVFALSLNLVFGGGENFSSNEDDLNGETNLDQLDGNERTARHVDQFFNFGVKTKQGPPPHHGVPPGHLPHKHGQGHGFGHGFGHEGPPNFGPVSQVKNWLGFGKKPISKIDATESFIRNARLQLPAVGSCRQPLQLPDNVMYDCRDSSCKLSCKKKFFFPGGRPQLNVICMNGQWIVRDSDFGDQIPACAPACIPPCQNNGICIEPGLCKCPENYFGPLCQSRNLQCASRPPMPKNSKVSCRNNNCNVECIKGYQFPDGTGITNLECLNGEWKHPKSGNAAAPDCQPICDPPCANGGSCVSLNLCQCPKDFKGPRCQYGLEVCNVTKFGFNGNYRCSFEIEEAACSLTCPDGIKMSGPLTSTYKCKYSSGQFYPPIPNCIYPKGFKVISSSKLSVPSGGHYLGYNHGRHETNNMDNSLQFISKWKTQIQNNELFTSSEETFEAPPVYSLYFEEYIDVTIDKSPKPALCATWSGINLKTFDGTIFKAPLSCSHTMVSDKIDGTFEMILKACPFGSGYNCPHTLKIFWQSIVYTFENANGTIKLSTPQKNLPIPVQVKGMKVLPVAQHLQIHLDSVGLTLLWDKYQYVAIQAGQGLWKRTGGLCGSLDGDYQNDFASKDGVRLKTGKAFVDSWVVPDESDLCFMDNSAELDFFKQCDPLKQAKAVEICEQLLTNSKLTECVKPFNMNALMKSCVNDYCNCANMDQPEKCNCDAIAMLAKECEFRGIKLEHGWRNLQICPIQCNYGRVYLPCGPNLEPTCGSAVVPNKDKCNEGCFCPEGTVQYKDLCISPELCPCTMRNKELKAGSTIKKDCNSCTCKNGVWKCTDENCGARCGAIGDPHYTTFDGKKFDFMGKCSYYLLKTDNMTVEAENVPCSGAISESMDYAPANTLETPSCTKSVTITAVLNGAETSIKLGQNLITYVNDKEILKLPKVLGSGQAIIRQASSTFITVDFADGIRVWWDGQTRVYIDAPPTYREKTTGLCGTFNSKTQDDFLTPEGDIESAVEPFANKWRTKDTCDDLSNESGPHSCTTNPQMREIAEKHCAWLTDDIFLDCQWSVEPETYYENCIYDVCACKEDPAKCFCPILSAYGAECARQGIKTGWRYTVKECGIQCPVGQIYEECGDSCTRTCEDVATKDTCIGSCIEGCRCPKGEFLNDKNECVPANECPCTFDGMTFKTGYKEVRPGRKFLELCVCEGGVWDCDMAEPGDKEKYPPSSELRNQCANKPFAEFSKCVPIEPKTCKNMHTYTENLEDCTPGCACKDGFVFDTTTKECVKPEDCSCHHGGKSYSDGDQITEDCNVCLCKSGNWKCTTNVCEATCSVWGDSHFTTFDNHDFDFQGACDYILSKGVAANGDSFSITIQNVLCGSLGVTCSKSLQITLGGSITDTITLSADSSYLNDQSKSPINKLREELGSKGHSYNIYKAGLFTVIEIIPLKLQIKWDEGTRVYVKLGKEWKGKVNGLCGNYNDNANDDMKTPSQGLETSPFLFGHSWKLQEFCAAPTQQIDACKEHPERETWAQLKCGILKSSVFKECHSEVPVEKYLKRCIFDTCACDQGGDCECLCTAIAAYAHSCSIKGVNIRWRTPHLCPMQCDPHCSEYKPCTPVCAIETCDNFLDQGIADRMCLSENCIEGCQIKPCEEGMIYLNDSFTQCVPKSECKPLCMLKDGKSFYEGDVTFTDECQTCRCTKKKEVCSGVPCVKQLNTTTVSPIEASSTAKPQQIEEQPKCVSGWTRWFNQDQDSTERDQKLKLNDEEKLPKFDRFESIYGTCSKEFMKKIDCRVVDSHEKADLMDENVFCKLEQGLVCRGNCHDYEIRVFCRCGSEEDEEVVTEPPAKLVEAGKTCDGTMEEYKEFVDDCYKFLHCQPQTDGSWAYVEKTCGPTMMFNPVWHVCDHAASVQALKPICGGVPETTEPAKLLLCPPGKVWSECANHCEHTCHFYGHTLTKRGLCNKGDQCKGGCVDETEPNCPNLGQVWRDRSTCVEIDECPCMSNDEEYIKPHSIYKQVVSGNPETCQCIDNTFLCKGYAEPKEVTTQIPEFTIIHLGTSTEKPFIVPTTTTPPPKCDPKQLVPMINGAIPLPDTVFGASSTLGDSYLPQFGRLHSKPIGESKGSWSPLINDQMQYLQVAFDEPQPLFGVIMQGSPISDQYVTLFKILHSHDGVGFHYLVDETDKPQLFNGPIDPRTPVESLFKIPIEAKVVRIYPLKWHGSIAMRAELLGCSKEPEEISTEGPAKYIATTETTRGFVTTTSSWEATPECADPMGVENGAMHPTQVKASSIWPRPIKAKKPHLLDMLKMSSSIGWRPVLNSPNEYVEFDFLEPRNVSGLTTMGGPEGWVTGYKVMYSNNAFVWNNILGPDGNPKLFIANNDQDTPQTNHFKFPIQTQMLKVVPIKWEKDINMRIEPLGCFHSYPEVKETVEVLETKPTHCPVCDNVVVSPDEKECKCSAPLLWDGSECVDRNVCPCVENYISYPIGSKFENKDCQECVCVLGGIKQCKPKRCPTCDTGLRIIQTPTCICKCEPCPEMQKLCPSSGDCIPESLWCNGVKDCEDDEPEECTKVIEDFGKPSTETNTTTIKTCPEPECPKGMKMKIIEKSATRKMSKIFKSTVTKKFSTFNDGQKITRIKSINRIEEYLPVPELESGYDEIEQCAEFVCTPDMSSTTVKNVSFSCTLPKCPDDYEVEIDNSKMKPGDCLKYTCILRPQKDHVCELSGKSFTTFDGTEFKYETCSHILARNLVNSTWYISVQLNCTENRKICRKLLTIKDISSNAVLTIMPNQKLKFNGFVYTPQQLDKSPLAKSAFIISQPGNTILVVSRLHGFWASYDEIGGIKIGVSEKFIKTVDGLCGYFNGNPADDKRCPDGSVTSSTNKFGDSWFDKEIPKDECYPQVCPRDVQMKALALCNSIKHPSFLKCGKAVNYKQFVSKCIETTCECLKANKGGTQPCKCSILQGFVKQCLAKNPHIQLDTWRAVHQCEMSCPAPLVHSDCYKRRCEPSCDNLNGDDCPVLPDACFSGCYCPEGTLRKGDTCIPINECKDCICDAFGASKYLTYDRKNFTFNGNCTYLLSRDIVLPGVHTFQVYVTMDDCKKLGRLSMGPNTSCAKSLHILHGDGIIHIQRVVPNKSVQVLIDGMEVKKLPFKNTWLGITETSGRELKLTLPESHVEVTSSFDDMAFSIRVPSIKYGSKMEGLCGDCNGDPDNDLQMNPSKKKKKGWKPSSTAPVDIMNVVESWQADEPKLQLDQDECLSEEVPVDSCIPLPPEKDPCFKLFDERLFGKCNMIVSPLIYVSACQQDICLPGNEQKGACNSLAAYARECARNGICLDWRSADLCPYDCPAGLAYEACGCAKTCESLSESNMFEVINLRTSAVMNTKKAVDCSEGKSEGCFCPPGKVLDNDKCILEEQCTKCDDGDHSVGETWKKDKCTECKCNKDGKTECIEQQCPVQESICSEGFMPSKITSSEDCCPKYICVPEPKVPTPVICPDAPFPQCGPGQFKKQKIGADNCPQFICECKPVSECEPLEEVVPLKIGEKVVRDNSGCCPTQSVVCDTKTCPELVTTCEHKFYEFKIVTHLGDCCPSVVCTPPRDACIDELDGVELLKPLGDKWKVLADPCLQKICTYGPNDTTLISEIKEKCNKNCVKGFEYQNLDDTKCCGSCVQTKCVFEERLYVPGDTWYSADNCTTYSCIDADGQILISSSKEVCLDISDCPLEQVEDQGCCKICKPIPESQKNCLPTSLSEGETTNLVRVVKPGHGICLNKEPILGFTECAGSCQSGSKYNAESFGQDKVCFCCSIETYKTISVPLVCADGLKINKDIEIPSSCGCSACSDATASNFGPMFDIHRLNLPSAPIKRLT